MSLDSGCSFLWSEQFWCQRYLLDALIHIRIWQMSSQLGWGDTCQIWTWYLMQNRCKTAAFSVCLRLKHYKCNQNNRTPILLITFTINVLISNIQIGHVALVVIIGTAVLTPYLCINHSNIFVNPASVNYICGYLISELLRLNYNGG